MPDTQPQQTTAERLAELEGFAHQWRHWIEANTGQRRRLGEMRAASGPSPALDDMIDRAEQAGRELEEALGKLEALIAGLRSDAQG